MLFLFHCNHRCTNVPQCDVMRTLPVSFHLFCTSGSVPLPFSRGILDKTTDVRNVSATPSCPLMWETSVRLLPVPWCEKHQCDSSLSPGVRNVSATPPCPLMWETSVRLLPVPWCEKLQCDSSLSPGVRNFSATPTCLLVWETSVRLLSPAVRNVSATPPCPLKWETSGRLLPVSCCEKRQCDSSLSPDMRNVSATPPCPLLWETSVRLFHVPWREKRQCDSSLSPDVRNVSATPPSRDVRNISATPPCPPTWMRLLPVPWLECDSSLPPDVRNVSATPPCPLMWETSVRLPLVPWCEERQCESSLSPDVRNFSATPHCPRHSHYNFQCHCCRHCQRYHLPSSSCSLYVLFQLYWVLVDNSSPRDWSYSPQFSYSLSVYLAMPANTASYLVHTDAVFTQIHTENFVSHSSYDNWGFTLFLCTK